MNNNSNTTTITTIAAVVYSPRVVITHIYIIFPSVIIPPSVWQVGSTIRLVPSLAGSTETSDGNLQSGRRPSDGILLTSH